MVEKSLQVVGQLLRRPVALGRLLAERLQDDRLESGGRNSRSRSRAQGDRRGDFLDQRIAVAALEGWAEREQFVERRPQ